MLQLTLPKMELFDSETNTFYSSEEKSIELEHSLLAVSQWESKWHEPFLTSKPKTPAKMMDYVRCMVVTPNVDPIALQYLPEKEIRKVNKYIEDPMTATTINQNSKSPPSREIVTSELIYYWMIECDIPFECERWHLNRLLTLIRVCDIKRSPQKKMSRHELMQRNTTLNQARKSKFNTRG